MTDLISRQALMKEFSDFVRESNNSDFAQTPTWNDAVSLVGSMPSAQQWIPCSERLPKPDREVFVYLFDKCPFIAWVDDGGMWNTDDFIIEDEDTNPQAWIPLPNPWKGDSE